jgi:hypothetical protein
MSQPIQNVDSIDIVGLRNDAGIDLVVLCSGPLDGSAETLRALREKVRGYIEAACSEHIWKESMTGIKNVRSTLAQPRVVQPHR